MHFLAVFLSGNVQLGRYKADSDAEVEEEAAKDELGKSCEEKRWGGVVQRWGGDGDAVSSAGVGPP